MERVSIIEQESGSEIISIITESGATFHIAQSVLEKFIQDNGLNSENEYAGNNSPYGDCDPTYDLETASEQDAADYLDNHLYQVCELYLNNIPKSTTLKHVA